MADPKFIAFAWRGQVWTGRITRIDTERLPDPYKARYWFKCPEAGEGTGEWSTVLVERPTLGQRLRYIGTWVEPC